MESFKQGGQLQYSVFCAQLILMRPRITAHLNAVPTAWLGLPLSAGSATGGGTRSSFSLLQVTVSKEAGELLMLVAALSVCGCSSSQAGVWCASFITAGVARSGMGVYVCHKGGVQRVWCPAPYTQLQHGTEPLNLSPLHH